MSVSKKCLLVILIPNFIGLILVGFIVYSVLVPSSRGAPVVRIKQAAIQGVESPDGDYDMYLGIPYADVNTSNVFGDAIPKKKFKKYFLANNDSFMCPQLDEFNKTISGTLDCLRLNIYVPKTASTKNHLPVLVFLHGGDYKTGYSSRYIYGPKYLIRYDIIVITFNYRLGPYGFMCANKPQVGNQGMKDQILALKWIKKYISHFGGNANKVTIAGIGSGGENVNLHLLYDHENLFEGAIIESGIYIKDSEEVKVPPSMQLAEKLKCPSSNVSEALEYLNYENVKYVIAASIDLHLNYGPCVEKPVGSAEQLINNRTHYFLENLRRVSILIDSSNKDTSIEYAYRNFDHGDALRLFFEETIRHFDLDNEQHSKIQNDLYNFYIGEEKNKNMITQIIVDFTSDIHHHYPTKRMIEKYLKDGAKKIYWSVFSYSGGRNIIEQTNDILMKGAAQGDVLGYIFDTPMLRVPDVEDKRVIDYMTTIWTNFVKYGDPTPIITESLPMKWEPVREGKLNYLDISTELTSDVTPFRNRTEFWDLLYKVNGINEHRTRRIEPWRI